MVAQNFRKAGSTKPSEEAMKKFNWGAFFMPFLWGLWYKKANLVFFSILLFVMTLVFLFYIATQLFNGIKYLSEFAPNMVLTIVENLESVLPIAILGFIFILLLHLFFGIYCGKNGNRWAWLNKSYSNESIFESTQKKWAIGSFIFKGIPATLFILCIILFFVVLPMFIDQFKQITNKLFFIDSYLKLQQATIVAQKGSAGSINKYLYDEKGLVAVFYIPYFDEATNKGVGFITKENYMYAFKIINKECEDYPEDFNLQNTNKACAKVHIDINGQNGLPNKNSTIDNINDRFVLYVFKNGVVAPKGTIEYNILNDTSIGSKPKENNSSSSNNFEYNTNSESFVKAFEKINNAVARVVKDTGKPLPELVSNKVLLFASFSRYLSIKEIKPDGFVDQDGVYFKIQFINNSCPVKPQGNETSDACIKIIVDINSNEQPNKMSTISEIADRFTVYGYSEGVYTAPGSVEANLLGK